MRDYAKFFWPQRDCNPQMNKLRVISYTSSWPGECGRFCRDKVVLFCCFNYGWMSHLVCLAPDVEGIKTIVKICENADFSFLYKEALKRCTNYSQKRLKSPSSTKLILSGRFLHYKKTNIIVLLTPTRKLQRISWNWVQNDKTKRVLYIVHYLHGSCHVTSLQRG